MRFLPEVSQETGQRCAVVEHNGQKLSFNIQQYAKPDNWNLVIRHINDYWAKLPQATQSAIWDCYARAHETLEETSNRDFLLKDIRKVVNELTTYHNYDQVLQFTYLDTGIKIPLDLKTEYGPDAPAGPLTYLRPEYIELLGLMMVFRPLIPILGAYMFKVRDEEGALLKEDATLSIISMSNIINLPAYERLKRYINAYVAGCGDDIPLTAVLNGIGSEKLPEWLLALIIIRRISVAELADNTVPGPAVSLVSNIYNYLRQRINTLPKSFSTGTIRDKAAASQSDKPGDESNTSNAENYKIKEDRPGAVVAAHSVFLEGHSFIATSGDIAKKVDSTIDPNLVSIFVNLNNANVNFDVTDIQLTFVQYTLNKIMGPRSGPALAGAALLNAVSITQALLWHWKLYDLAAICGANVAQIPMDQYPTIQRLKLTKEQVDRFVLMYPNYQLIRGKKENRTHPSLLSKEDAIKQNIANNEGIGSIEIWTDAITSYAWVINLDKNQREKLQLLEGEYGMLYGANIRRDLADFYIKLYDLTYVMETKQP